MRTASKRQKYPARHHRFTRSRTVSLCCNEIRGRRFSSEREDPNMGHLDLLLYGAATLTVLAGQSKPIRGSSLPG
jgi:hypothetical protein